MTLHNIEVVRCGCGYTNHTSAMTTASHTLRQSCGGGGGGGDGRHECSHGDQAAHTIGRRQVVRMLGQYQVCGLLEKYPINKKQHFLGLVNFSRNLNHQIKEQKPVLTNGKAFNY